jgi:hypothetical protein
MEFDSVLDLVKAVYGEILYRNTSISKDVIPVSTEFYPYLTKKLNIDPDKIPEIMEILSEAKMIFSFVLANSSIKQDIVSGFVVTKGDIILTALKRSNESLETLYSNECNRKIPAEKLILELSGKREKYNNTPIGIAANISMMLSHYRSLLERNILQYSDKIQMKLLTEALRDKHSVEEYIKKPEKIKPKAAGSSFKREIHAEETPSEPSKPNSESTIINEFKSFSKNHPIEKTLKIYGIELYTRSCFRDYQFNLIQKLLDDGHISTQDDLLKIKQLLEKERMNSDENIKLNEYAAEINSLMKCINDKLKAFK